MKGYRSHIINTLTALVAILALPEVGGLVAPEYVTFIPLAQGVIAIIMRQITTTPVGEAKS